MSQQHSRIGFVPRSSYDIDAAMQLLELGNQRGVHSYTHDDESKRKVRQVQSVGDYRSHSVGAQSVQSVGDYRSHSVGAQSVQSVGDFRSHSVGAQSVQSVGDYRSHSVGAQSVQSVGDYRSHSVGAQPVQSVGDYRSHSVGAQSVQSVGDYRSHSVGAQPVQSVGDYRSHSVGAQSVQSVGDYRSHSVGAQPVQSVGDYRSHSVGAQSVQSVGDYRSHSVGAQSVQSVGDFRSHSVGAQSVQSVGDFRSHSVGAQSVQSVGDYRSHSVGAQPVQSVGDFRSHSVGAQSVQSVGDFRSHSVGAQSVQSVGDYRSHSVGAQSVQSVGDYRSHSVGAQPVQSVGDYRSHSVGAQSVQSVGDYRSHSVGAQPVQSVGDYRSHSVGAQSVQSVGDYRSHSVGAQSVQSVGDYRSHSVGAQSVQSVGGYRSHSVAGQPVQSVATITTHSSQVQYSMDGRQNIYTFPTSGFSRKTIQQRHIEPPSTLSAPPLTPSQMVAPQQPPLPTQSPQRNPQLQSSSLHLPNALDSGNTQLSSAIASLKQAEEDRFIAWQLVERILASINLEEEDTEELRDKQEALKRASKRLEEKSEKVELKQKKAGIHMEERLDAVERHELQAMKVNSMLRKVAKKLSGDEPTFNKDVTTRHTGIRLPKMELKTFDGNVRRWHEFWECFEHGVHNNGLLPDHQKLQYLKNCLKGAAFVTISDLDMKGDHYHAAVQLLKERYGHKNVLRKSHFDGLESLPMISHTYDVQKLKRFYDELECHIKALAAIDVKPEEYATTMIPKVISKLPVDIRIKLTEGQDENEDLSVVELLEGLRKSIKVMEKCGVHMKTPSEHGKTLQQKSQKPSFNSPSRPLMSSGATLTSTEKRDKCEFCLGQHKATACSKYETAKDREIVLKKYNRCFGCLKKGHMLRQCRNSKVCKKCSKEKHHETLCEAGKEPTGVIGSALLMGPTAAVAYQTVKAKMQSADGRKEVTCRVLLDSGSARSFITEKLARRLESEPVGARQCQKFEGLNETVQELETECHMVKLTSLDGKYSDVLEVKTLPAITTIGNPAPLKLKQLFPHLKDLFFTDVTQKLVLEVDMLLGSEHLAELQTGCIRKGKRGEPVAVKTKLGWTLMGSTNQCAKKTEVEPTNLIVEEQKEINGIVSKLWDLETLGIRETDPVHMALEEEIVFNGERYAVPLPWREGKFKVPVNRGLAEGRLRSQLRKLKNTPRILEEYDKIIKEQLQEGIVEEVPDNPSGSRITYIPHQAVIREDAATTKVRIVYDASAKVGKGIRSLNECLHTGPSLNPLLYAMLLKFRMHPIVIMADIKQAFLQIEIVPEDRDVMRFLWVKDVKSQDPELWELRFTRAIFGAGPSPFILSATIHHHLNQYKDKDLVEEVKTSLYVDDYLSGGNDIEELVERKQKLQKIFEDGGFCLRKWYSNNSEVCSQINPEASNEQRKVLGVIWQPDRDALQVDLNIEDPKRPVTKRVLLSCLASIYDPLGLAGPVVLKARAIFQAVCAKGIGWNEMLPEEELKQFNSWLKNIKEMNHLSIPRKVINGGAETALHEVNIHVFCDASSVGYCAAVYVVTTYSEATSSNLLTAKCRLAPLKGMTIPRLELLSAVTGARLAKSVMEALKAWKIGQIFMWLDSTTALYWIENKGAWKPFVNNRVKEIHKLVPDASWYHCPTEENPSDLGTRGATAARLQNSELWWEGPQFLKQGKHHWPTQPCDMKPSEEAEVEEKAPVLTIKTEGSMQLAKVIDATRYSSFRKLIGCVAWVTRFTKNCRLTRKSRKLASNLSAEELKDARVLVLMAVQEEMKQQQDFQSRVRDLGAYLHEDGFIRCGGRLKNAMLTFDQRHPILLPTKGRVVELIVEECHRKVEHERVGRTLAEVRSQFWIPRGRQLVKSVLKRCERCKVFAIKHLNAPQMAPLPDMRVVRTRPFQHTGVDFAGPLYIKTNSHESAKAYIALFTCATTRAVHLELTADMTAKTFRMALERFVATWGMPNLMVSDNGSTFKATAIDLERLCKHPEVQSYLQINYLSWKFNLSLAAWWGGWFEKMVGLTKSILRRSLGRAMLWYEELEVILKKTQAILNNRPLSYQGEEFEEETLTPNHLIFGHRLPQMPDLPEDLLEEDDASMRLKHMESRLDQIWDRWKKEYLVGLREFHKPKVHKKGSEYGIKPGDIVLIESNGTHRGLWKKGKVIKVLKGKDDNIIRGVALETIVNGVKRRLERAIQQIYPLELCTDSTLKKKEEKLLQKTARCSERIAAKKAKAIISTITEDINQEDND